MRELLNPALPQVRDPLPELPPAPPAEPPPDPGRPGPGGHSPGGHGPGGHGPGGRRPQGPMVQRIACWSARHRVAVIAGWLVLAVVALLGGHLLGTQSQPQYDPGQSGQAEQMLSKLGVVTPPAESVLIQARGTGPGRTYVHDPALRGAVAEVVSALHRLPRAAADIRSPLSPGGQVRLADGRTALITFQVAGPNASADSTVNADLAAVARVQASHPGLLVRGGPLMQHRPGRQHA